MSTPQNPTPPAPPASLPISGELSLQDLEKLAGGAPLPDPNKQAASESPSAPNPELAAMLTPGELQPPTIEKKVDSSYTSVIGATGTAGNEAALTQQAIPIDLKHTFP